MHWLCTCALTDSIVGFSYFVCRGVLASGVAAPDYDTLIQEGKEIK